MLQQLVKAQRENVSEIISDEQAQIRKIKEQLNDEVRHVTLEHSARAAHRRCSHSSWTRRPSSSATSAAVASQGSHPAGRPSRR